MTFLRNKETNNVSNLDFMLFSKVADIPFQSANSSNLGNKKVYIYPLYSLITRYNSVHTKARLFR